MNTKDLLEAVRMSSKKKLRRAKKGPRGSRRIENTQLVIQTTEKRYVSTKGEDGEMAVRFYLHDRGRLAGSVSVETHMCLGVLELVVRDPDDNIIFVHTAQVECENEEDG